MRSLCIAKYIVKVFTLAMTAWSLLHCVHCNKAKSLNLLDLHAPNFVCAFHTLQFALATENFVKYLPTNN